MAAIRLRRAFTLAKREEQPNEDAIAHREARGLYAVSDGASTAFEAGRWSRILAERFMRKPAVDWDWIEAAVGEFEAALDIPSLPWYAQDAFERGSFASLLAIRLRVRGEVRLFGYGDSLALLCDGARIVETWPYTSAAEFDQRPILISTSRAQNAQLGSDGSLAAHEKRWSLTGLAEPRLLAVTDALGHWLLSASEEVPPRLDRLCAAESEEAFAALVAEERLGGRMRLDDTSFIGLW